MWVRSLAEPMRFALVEVVELGSALARGWLLFGGLLLAAATRLAGAVAAAVDVDER